MKRILAVACLALVLAGGCRRQTAGRGAPQPATVAQLSRDAAAWRDRCVTVSGRLGNAGGNYFTDLRLELADSTGAAVAVKPWLPLELPPPRPGAPRQRPAVLSDYLGKRVTIRACLRRDTEPSYLEVQSIEIITETDQ